MISFLNIKNIILKINIIKCSIVFIIFIFGSVNYAYSLSYEEVTLRNGLSVYIIKTKSPIVTHAIAYNVGSLEEESGKEGIAHFLEHAMFLGTNRYSKKQFTDIIKETGAYYNAFTSFDITLYYLNIPARHLKKAIQIESDRMRWLLLNDKDVENEKKVINEERKMYQNNVYNIFYDNMRRYTYPTTNYGRSLIGWEGKFNLITSKDLRNFYEQWYAPDNAKIFIIGDVNVNEVKKLINTYYGNLYSKKKFKEAPKIIEEEYQSIVKMDFKDPRINQELIVKTYLVPSFASDSSPRKSEAYSLLILEEILSSRFGVLYKTAVLEKKFLVDFSVKYEPDRKGSSTFSFSLVPSEGISKEEALEKFTVELEKVLSAKFSSTDLRISRKRIQDKFELLKENEILYLFMMAQYINSGMSFNDMQRFINNLSVVSANDLNKVVNEYINNKHYVVAFASNGK